MTKAEMLSRLKTAASMIDEVTLALESERPVEPVPLPDPWLAWIGSVCGNVQIPNEIKPAIIAQSIIETGRGSSLLFNKYNNPLGFKYRDEMKGWAIPVNVSVTSEPSGWATFCHFSTIHSASQGWVRWMERSPYDGWRQHVDSPESFLRFVCPIWAADPDYLEKCLNVLPEAIDLAVASGWSTTTPIPTGKLRGKKILIDPGHSKSAQGAHGRGSTPPSEYAMNSLQAIVVRDMLRAEGAEVSIFDPNPDSLTAVGRQAKGMDLFLSLHHNAANADGNDEGTETYVPPGAGSEARRLAQSVNRAICLRIGSRDRGVKEKGYTVIATAHSVGCQRAILVESYFIDDYASLDVVTNRSKEAAKAIAEAIITDGL